MVGRCYRYIGEADIQMATTELDECAQVADLGRSSSENAGFEPGGRGFESLRARHRFNGLAFLHLLTTLVVCQICATDRAGSRQTLRKFREMIRSEVRIAPHHIRRLPTPELLQDVWRRARLCVP